MSGLGTQKPDVPLYNEILDTTDGPSQGSLAIFIFTKFARVILGLAAALSRRCLVLLGVDSVSFHEIDSAVFYISWLPHKLSDEAYIMRLTHSCPNWPSVSQTGYR